MTETDQIRAALCPMFLPHALATTAVFAHAETKIGRPTPIITPKQDMCMEKPTLTQSKHMHNKYFVQAPLIFGANGLRAMHPEVAPEYTRASLKWISYRVLIYMKGANKSIRRKSLLLNTSIGLAIMVGVWVTFRIMVRFGLGVRVSDYGWSSGWGSS